MIKAQKQKSSFTPCPEGSWPGLCIDVVDKGMVPTEYGPKHKIQIRWLADAEPPRQDKRPYMVSKTVNLSMNKKSTLRPMLELWRGKMFSSDSEAYDFDIEKLIGAPCHLQVAQKQGDEGPYAFVQAVFKALPGPRIPMPTDYVREQDRPGYVRPEMPEEEIQEEVQFDDTISDDDIPF